MKSQERKPLERGLLGLGDSGAGAAYPTDEEYRETLSNVGVCAAISIEHRWYPREDLLCRVADTESKAKDPRIKFKRLWNRLKSMKIKKWGAEFKLARLIIKKPQVLRLWTPKNLHKLRLLRFPGPVNVVFILPLYTEPTFFRELLRAVALVRGEYTLITPAVRTEYYKALVQKAFPSARSYTNLPNKGMITYPGTHKEYKLDIFLWRSGPTSKEE